MREVEDNKVDLLDFTVMELLHPMYFSPARHKDSSIRG
jgi:hypothetical protein